MTYSGLPLVAVAALGVLYGRLPVVEMTLERRIGPLNAITAAHFQEPGFSQRVPHWRTTFCGQVVYENRAGTERFYAPDPLGSTAALLDSTGAKTDEYVYWPYGEIRSHTGTSATPLTFCGTLGYFMDSATRFYVRARMLLANYARWLTVDPLWPLQPPYAYCSGSPVRSNDMTGLAYQRVECSPSERKACRTYCKNVVGSTVWICIGIEVWVCGVLVFHNFRCICNPFEDIWHKIRRIISEIKEGGAALCPGLCSTMLCGLMHLDPPACDVFCYGLCLRLFPPFL